MGSLEKQEGTRKSSSGRPHAVAVPCPFTGHLTPFLDLCHLLEAHGFIVTLITTPRFLPTLRIQAGLNIHLVLVDDGLPVDYVPRINDMPNYLHHMEMLRWPVQKQVAALQADATSSIVTCIISDSHLGWTQDVANDLKLPRICFLTSSTIEFSAIFHQPLLVEQGVLPLKPRNEAISDIISCIPGLPPVHRTEMLTFQQVEDTSDFEFQYFSRQCSRVAEAERLLTTSFYDFEVPMVEALAKRNIKVKPIGPMVLIANYKAQNGVQEKQPRNLEEWEKWLDQQKPKSVVFIAFGSIANLTEHEVKAIAGGLELARCKFVWALRDGIVEGMEDPLPKGFRERAMEEDRGLLVPWLSQRRLLRHSAIGAFMTHSGWGSTMESVHAGVPVLSWPLYGDQCLNCKLVTEIWKAGVKVASELVYDRRVALRAEHVASSITTLLSSSEYTLNMSKLCGLAFQAWQPGGSSYKNFFEFVQDMHAMAAQEQWHQP